MLGTLWPCTIFIFHSHTVTGNLFIGCSDMVTCCWIHCTVKVNIKVPKKKLERTFSVFITITLHQQCVQEAIDFKYFWKYLGVLSPYKITSKLTSIKWSCRTTLLWYGMTSLILDHVPRTEVRTRNVLFVPLTRPKLFKKHYISS